MIVRVFRQAVLGIAATLCLSGAVVAQEDLPVSLVSYNGERPVPLAPDDPLFNSVGMLFAPPEELAKMDPQSDGYATAFLVSECYALAGTAAAGQLAVSERMFGGSTIELIGVRFGIGLKPGFDLATLSEKSFRATWPVTAHQIVPREVDDELFATSRWWLLHLDGCEAGDEKNGTPLAFDPVTNAELQADGLPKSARHVGMLMTDQLSLVELPCQILGQIRQLSWESTCSSWLGMMGGPVLSFDPQRKAWTAIGFIPLGNLALLLTPSGRLSSGKRSFDVYGVDEKNPRFFDYTTNVVTMAQTWPWIRDSIEADHPGLMDTSRANVAERETNLKQSLLMQMRQRPETTWSAFDYTRFALGLESLGLDREAAKFLKSAFVADPTYLPAAFRLSREMDWLGPWGMADRELEMLKDAMGQAAAQYPEDPQLILGRIYTELKLAQYSGIIEDTEKFLAASIQHRGPSSLFVDLGDAYLGIGEMEKAQGAFSKAQELDAMNANATTGLARMKLYGGDIEGAVRLAEKAVRTDPDGTGSRMILAIALAQAGDLDGAIAATQEACERCGASASLPVYLALFRGYKQAIEGNGPGAALLLPEEVAGTYEEIWPREMAEVFLGLRSLESLAGFDYSGYTPDWRQSIRIGRLAFSAAYDLSQDRPIDFPAIEKGLTEDRSLFYAHLVPILKDWSERVAARRQ